MSILKVAELAGVSHSTVSRVINGRRGISDETANVVREAMREIGYRPAPTALRRGRTPQGYNGIRTGNIAVLWSESLSKLGSVHFIEAIQSIGAALAENNLNMVACCIPENGAVPPIISNRDIDGCIVVSGELDKSLSQKLEDIPKIWLSSRHTSLGDYVVGGNEQIGQMAANYLIGKGLRELAFLNSKPNHPAQCARGMGFKFAAFQKGIDVVMLSGDTGAANSAMSQSIKDLEVSVVPLVKRLLSLPKLPQGLFVPQDRITAVVYKHLKRASVIPGRDIVIVSADNEEPFLAGLDPRPATIDIGSQANGRHAVEQLLWRMRHPKDSRAISITIEPILIEAEN